ncbi:MAG: RHS repeat-associated core domain-containing protein [Acidobacteria bacterium]|nr:RHS repeat-associated core domain-containing protein [Acidobacteriota bacterium]
MSLIEGIILDNSGGTRAVEKAPQKPESQVTAVEYGYNAFGYLASARTQTPQATSEAAYTYSYDGKRISKYIDGTLYDYTYTGSNLLETYADTVGRIARYSYGNALISQTDATGNTESTITDYQNSVIALLNPSTIHDPLSTAFAYDPFGKLRYTNNSDTPQTLGWLSRQYDKETDNNYLINRYYNADRGSFLSPDQYQYVDSAIPFTWNLYQYAFANPLVNTDPEGLRVVDKGGQRYQGIDTVSGTEMLIPQIYYHNLSQMIGNDGGTLQVTGPDEKTVILKFSASDLKNGTVATRVMEGRMLQLYGEERVLDAIQITTAAAEFSSNFVAAAISVPALGVLSQVRWLAGGIGMLTAGTMSHHFGERLAERQESGSGVFASTVGATSDAVMFSELYAGFTNRDIITGENAGYSLERRSGILGGFFGGLFGLKQLANSYTGDVAAKVKIIDAAGSNSGPNTWNEFQSATKGMFSSRAKAARAWQVYKGSPQRVVIVGETMSRVEVGAMKLPGVRILNDMPDFASSGMADYQVTSEMMQYNRAWILEQIRNGRLFINIGNDPNRRTSSIFYQMEGRMLRNYQRLHPNWDKVVYR